MLSVRATPTNQSRTPRLRAKSSRYDLKLVSLPRATRRWVIGILYVIAFIATTAIGMRCMFDFQNGQPPLTSTIDLAPFAWAWHHLWLFAEGLPFSITLFAIFGAHRSGHYLARRLFRLEEAPGSVASGAKSSTDGFGIFRRTNSRAETIAIGAAGPVAGFIVAVAATCYGLTQSAPVNPHASASLLRISAPALIGILRSTMLASYPDIPPVLQMLPHPVLVAAWSGLLLTALTLLPAGGLDGGKILYAISPRWHRIISALSIGAILYLGTVEWIGWLLLALFLIEHSSKHFRSRAHTPLSVEWLVVAPLCLAIFLLTVSAQPIAGMSLTQVLLRIH
jgi:hypothetical protein